MAQMPTLEEAKAAVPRSTYRADIFIDARDFHQLLEKIDLDTPQGAVDPRWEKILAPTRPSPWAKDRIHLIVLGRAWKDYELEVWRQAELERRRRPELLLIAEAERAVRIAKRQKLDARLKREREARERDRQELAAESIAEGHGEGAPTCSLTPAAPPWMLSQPGTFRQFSDMEPIDMNPMPDDSVFRGVRYGRWMAKRGRRLGRLYGPMNGSRTKRPPDPESAKTLSNVTRAR